MNESTKLFAFIPILENVKWLIGLIGLDKKQVRHLVRMVGKRERQVDQL